jgi:hypothetical protein
MMWLLVSRHLLCLVLLESLLVAWVFPSQYIIQLDYSDLSSPKILLSKRATESEFNIVDFDALLSMHCVQLDVLFGCIEATRMRGIGSWCDAYLDLAGPFLPVRF